MGTTLDYGTPTPTKRHLSLRTAAVAGAITGISTFSSIFLVGWIYIGVGVLGGIFLSAVSARASRGYEFRAGIISSGFAAVAAVAGGVLFAPLLFGTSPLWTDPVSAALALAFWWTLFGVSGVFGSLWVWEGRRRRDGDETPPGE